TISVVAAADLTQHYIDVTVSAPAGADSVVITADGGPGKHVETPPQPVSTGAIRVQLPAAGIYSVTVYGIAGGAVGQPDHESVLVAVGDVRPPSISDASGHAIGDLAPVAAGSDPEGTTIDYSPYVYVSDDGSTRAKCLPPETSDTLPCTCIPATNTPFPLGT